MKQGLLSSVVSSKNYFSGDSHPHGFEPTVDLPMQQMSNYTSALQVSTPAPSQLNPSPPASPARRPIPVPIPVPSHLFAPTHLPTPASPPLFPHPSFLIPTTATIRPAARHPAADTSDGGAQALEGCD